MWHQVERLLAVFGLLSISILLISLSTFLHFYFIQGYALKSYHHGKDPWAVVTGASAGIGFALSLEITKYGFNVVLVGHNEDNLRKAAAQIERSSPGTKLKIIVLDATKDFSRDIQNALISANVNDLNVTVLINNVGGLGAVFTKHFKPFPADTFDELDSVLYINNRFMVHLTNLMIPILSSTGGRTLVINIGSLAERGTPYQTLYAGTKGFINSFSKALDWELKAEKYDIDVVDVVPGEVRSKTHTPKLGWAIPSADVFAKHALRTVGPGRGRHVVPYVGHRVQEWLLDSMPEWMQQRALADTMLKMRNKYDGKPEKRD